MITLNDCWAIAADEYCYILGQMKPRKDKNGEPIESFIASTYHNTVSGALQAYYAAQGRKLIKSQSITIPEAIEAFTALERQINALVSGVAEAETFHAEGKNDKN